MDPLPVPDLELVMVFLARRETEPELNWLRLLLRRCVTNSLQADPAAGDA